MRCYDASSAPSSQPSGESRIVTPEAERAALAPPPERQFADVRLDGAAGGRSRTFTMRFTLLAVILSLLVVSGLAINAVWFVKSRATSQVLAHFIVAVARRRPETV
jgi:hypothetical protein